MRKNNAARLLENLIKGEITLAEDFDIRKLSNFILAIEKKIKEQLNDPNEYHKLERFFINFKNSNPQTSAVIFRNIFDDDFYIEDMLYELLKIDLKILIKFANYFGVSIINHIEIIV